MTRAAAFLFALAAVAGADTAVLVDGEVLENVTLLRGDAKTVVFQQAGAERTLPAARIVSIAFDTRTDAPPDPYNLYLANGDRLRGSVSGAGESVRLESRSASGLAFPLASVKAVRFGRLLAGVKAKYVDAFRRELARGRDVVIVQRDTRPFPVYANVLAAGEKTLTVRLGNDRRELELHKIDGFVRTVETPDDAGGARLRAFLADGGRVTLPLHRITAEHVETADGGRLVRSAITRIELVGEHMRHLSSFEPIDVQQTALFGRPPRWRRDAMVLGGPLRLDGRTYARGIGVQAYSRLEFVLGRRWDAFFVRCGIDDTAGREGEATFRVLGDGKVLAEVTHRQGRPSARIRVDVKGLDRLVLEAVPGDSYISDFCDWAEARVFLAATVQDPPRDGE